MKWIYLKSNNLADALALATVLFHSGLEYHIVRRSCISPFFSNMDNVHIGFYEKSEGSELIVINEVDSDSWKQKCDSIAACLNIGELDSYKPYSGFVKTFDISGYLSQDKNYCLLYMFPHPDLRIDFIFIDQVIRIFEQQGVKAISGGSNMLPCIHGSLDLREVVDVLKLCNLLEKVKFVITTERDIASICEAFDTKAFVIAAGEQMKLDGFVMHDSNEMVNYINSLLY